MKRRHYLARLALWAGIVCLIAPWGVSAQTDPVTPTPSPSSPTQAEIPQVHKVQEGENLTVIAAAYGVTVEAILAVNNLTSADLLQIGQELIIPGGEGEAVPTVYRARPGDTPASIAADFNTTPEELAQSNRLISLTSDLLVGQPINVVSRTGTDAARPQTGRPYVVLPGDTLLAIAAGNAVSPAALMAANGLSYPAYLFPGMRLRIPDEGVAYRDLPDGWVDLQVRPQQIVQGSTVSIYVQNVLEGKPQGRLGDRELVFSPQGNGYVALLGLDAFTEPGIYELELGGGTPERRWLPLRERMRVEAADFGTQYVTVGAEQSPLLDPDVRAEEDAFFETVYGRFSEPRRWEGPFQVPVTPTVVTAGYGGGRSYNDGPVEIFHTGVDFGAPVGTPVVAPAPGVVVFSNVLELRGEAVIIDHGLGVMTGYYHLSERLVEEGDEVAAGEPIGAVGSTGLSSGAHLHWDLRIMNVPVNALPWTEQVFP